MRASSALNPIFYAFHPLIAGGRWIVFLIFMVMFGLRVPIFWYQIPEQNALVKIKGNLINFDKTPINRRGQYKTRFVDASKTQRNCTCSIFGDTNLNCFRQNNEENEKILKANLGKTVEVSIYTNPVFGSDLCYQIESESGGILKYEDSKRRYFSEKYQTMNLIAWFLSALASAIVVFRFIFFFIRGNYGKSKY